MSSVKRTVSVTKDEPREVFVCDGCRKEWVSPAGWHRLPPKGWLCLSESGGEEHHAAKIVGDFCSTDCLRRYLHLADTPDGLPLGREVVGA